MATRFTDGTGRTLEIEMKTWDGKHYTPDFENDFFNIGSLPYDEEADACKVDDVLYLFEQANDWKNAEGDFYGEEEPEGVERVVITHFYIAPEKEREIMRSARYTEQEIKRYLDRGKFVILVKEDYEDQRERFPEDFEGDETEEVHYAEREDYIIVTNWV